MVLVSFRLFCKNLVHLREFFGQMVYRPPLAKNFPYAYGPVGSYMLVFTVYFMGERSLEASDVTKHGRHLGNHGKRRRELVIFCAWHVK